MTRKAEAINEKLELINKQFDNYDTDIKTYKDYLRKKINEREEERAVGNTENQGSKEQTEIMEKMKGILTKMESYTLVMGKNQLI